MPQCEAATRPTATATATASMAPAPVTAPVPASTVPTDVVAPTEATVVPLNMEDLFDRHGTDALGYAALCEALCGEWVQFRAFIVRTHDDSRWMLVDQAGACPDCAPMPVASLQLPGFELPPGTSTEAALMLRGRLSYGFLIGEDGYASFLRLEQAHLFEGTPS